MLNRGLMKASNRGRIQFALMWANHTFVDIFLKGRPGNRGTIWPGEVDRQTFDAAVDHLLPQGYFKQPNYLRLEDKLYFSFYEIGTLIKGLGGAIEARAALDSFRRKVRKAGLGELHLNAILWQLPEQPSAVPGKKEKTKQETLNQLGFDSITSYTWAHQLWPGHPYTVYDDWWKAALVKREQWGKEFNTPYLPQVLPGFY